MGPLKNIHGQIVVKPGQVVPMEPQWASAQAQQLWEASQHALTLTNTLPRPFKRPKRRLTRDVQPITTHKDPR